MTELLANHLGTTASSYYHLETGLSTVSVFQEQKLNSAKTRQQIAAGLRHIRECGLDTRPEKIEIATVKREDWRESWKRHFHPLEIGKALLVKPSWSKKRPRKHQAIVVLDPGLSFGTGQHPTTSFCLSEVVHCRKSGMSQSFLDIGTGSGILAIAAAKIGYQPIHAFDFDPDAVRIARENARKNRVSDQVKLTRSDITKLSLTPARKYDLICANLISNLLISEKRRIVGRLKKGGTLVVAGILAGEFAEVERKFAAMNLKRVRRRVEKEWCSGSFCFV